MKPIKEIKQETFAEVCKRTLLENGFEGKLPSDSELDSFKSVYDAVIYYIGKWR